MSTLQNIYWYKMFTLQNIYCTSTKCLLYRTSTGTKCLLYRTSTGTKDRIILSWETRQGHDILLTLEGQSKEIFTSSFFHHLNQPGQVINGLKYFRFGQVCFRDIRIWISTQYDTPWCQCPHGMILRWVNLPAVSYCAESCDFSVSSLKGQSNKIFDLFFFIIRACLGHWVMGLNILYFWLRFCRVIRDFQDWLSSVSYCTESISPQYSMILRDVSLRAVLCGVNRHYFKL